MMVTLGTDAHKRSHTIVAVDTAGAEIGSVTVAATQEGHLRAVQWAAQYAQRQWAIEDCRALSRRLEADLLGVGERVVRVPPKMMARARATARQTGKSDPIDALPLDAQRCVNRTCRWRNSRARPGKSDSSSTTEKPLCTNAPGSRTSCGGGSTNSNPATTRQRDHSTGTAPSTRSTNSSHHTIDGRRPRPTRNRTNPGPHPEINQLERDITRPRHRPRPVAAGDTRLRSIHRRQTRRRSRRRHPIQDP